MLAGYMAYNGNNSLLRLACPFLIIKPSPTSSKKIAGEDNDPLI
jgi:hypothetical protein